MFGGHITTIFNDTLDSDIRRHRTDANDEASRSRLVGIPVMWDWPYAGLVLGYDCDKDMIAWRPNQIPERDLAWRIPLEYFGRMFRKGFWEDKVLELGETALHPPKDVGHCFKTNRSGNKVPMRPGKGQIPEGYRLGTGARNWTITRR